MSFVDDQIQRFDAQLADIHLSTTASASDDGDFAAEDATFGDAPHALSSSRIGTLLGIVRSLSATSSQSPLPAWRVRLLLSQSDITASGSTDSTVRFQNQYESEVEWLLVSKAMVQVYGLLLNTLLAQVIPLSDNVLYWDQVLSSYAYSSIYAIQTSPLRLSTLFRDTWCETKHQLSSLDHFPGSILRAPSTGLLSRWRRFYCVVHESIRARSIADFRRKALAPIELYRVEVRQKRAEIEKLRGMIANGIGLLVDDGLFVPVTEEGQLSSDRQRHHDWKGVVERTVALMDIVLSNVLDLEAGVSGLEDRVAVSVEEDAELSIHRPDRAGVDRPALLASRLLRILDIRLPEHNAAMRSLVAAHGKPGRVIRYWLPLAMALVSSSTILRIVLQRRADIITWIADLGMTVRDFWSNWVMDPLRKLVGTIRHDPNIEIAIMSLDSLRADRESLERMVVEFATASPQYVTASSSSSLPLSDPQIAEIRAQVGRGDITLVLRSFEKELRNPLVGAIRGDLIRCLLIQLQKLKVDVEVAIAGIDALLKNQALVFGCVSLAPGILITVGVWRYLRGLLGGNKTARAKRIFVVLDKIGGILDEASPVADNRLSHKDHGLLLCEVHLLRSLALNIRMLPETEFLRNLGFLVGRNRIQVQVQAVKRIRRACKLWLR